MERTRDGDLTAPWRPDRERPLLAEASRHMIGRGLSPGEHRALFMATVVFTLSEEKVSTFELVIEMERCVGLHRPPCVRPRCLRALCAAAFLRQPENHVRVLHKEHQNVRTLGVGCCSRPVRPLQEKISTRRVEGSTWLTVERDPHAPGAGNPPSGHGGSRLRRSKQAMRSIVFFVYADRRRSATLSTSTNVEMSFWSGLSRAGSGKAFQLVSTSHSSERMMKRTPSGISSEKLAPRPSTTSRVRRVCFQRSYC